MKNYKRILFCGILILSVLLTACQNPQIGNTEGTSEQNTESQSTENEVATDDKPTEKSAILENGSVFDKAGHIYYVPNDRVESGLQQEIALYNDNLLLWGHGQNSAGESGLLLSLISLQTGKVLLEKMFPDMDLPKVQVCGDKVVVMDWGLGTVSVLNKDFEVIDKYETNTSYCSIYLNTEATKIYCFTRDGVKVIDTAGGDTSMLFDNAVMLFASSRCKDAVSVTYTDKDTQMGESGIVDMSNGTAEKIPFEGAFYGVESCDGVWLVKVMGEENTYYLGKTDRPKAFQPNGENAIVKLITGPLRLMSTTYDKDGIATMTIYSLDGKYLSQCTLPKEVAAVENKPIWSEADGGYFFTAIDPTGKDMLLFWDISVPTTGEDLTLTSAYEESDVTDSTVSKELLDRAAAIGKTYGVKIFLGDQTEDSYGEYNVAHEMNETYNKAGLDALENALAQYPDGFMRQLLYGDQKQLEFHLTGSMTLKEFPQGNVNGFTSYIGFAQAAEGKSIIVVDITMAGSIEQTLHHEIMHIIDNKLTFDANITTDAFYSEKGWNSLNPDGFSYVEDKFHLPEDIYSDGYQSYFIDIYSRTNAKEDRARIMEYAMIDADWAFASSPGRLAKLEYICQSIRDAFHTEGWPKQTVWEKTLDRSRTVLK